MTFNSKPKSFVTRQGRITTNQKKALTSFWNKYVISEFSEIQEFIQGNYSLLDIGFGAGETLVSIAQNKLDISLLGAEVYQSGIGTVLSKADKFNLENIKIVNEDAEDLLQNKIPDNSFDAIIMFYPDPWPKRRHHKRRLIKKEFIDLLNKKLKPNGIFYFKTDWKDYFDKVNLLFEDPNWEDLNLKDLEEHLRDIPPTSFEKKAIQANRSLNTKIVRRVN